jgi:C-terminal peptidase prc
MVTMSRLALLAVLLAACSAPATVATTRDVPTTVPAPVTSTEAPSQEVSLQDCASPPATFSSLCEIYELLETWYVDAPLDPELLADVATRGLHDFTSTDTEDPPRILQCAIPHEAFSSLCDELAIKIEQSRVPVGPAVEAAVSYMIDVGLDPFTYYLPPDQAGALRLNGVVGGIGVLLDARDVVGSKCGQIGSTCRLEIVIVLEDNPGFEAGLEPGDVITAVNGEPVDGKGFTGIVSEIAGDETGTVELELDRAGETIDLTIERAELTVPTVQYAESIDGVAYIRIPDFESDIPGLVYDAIDTIALSEAGTVVVDLRDNPGGFIDSFLLVVDEFVDGGVVMVTDAHDEHLEYEAEPGGSLTTQRLLVLVNQGTASAAEILTGALRDRRDALVVGSNTFGKDAVQIPFTLRNGGEFHVAVAHWSTPNGDTAKGEGLTPDREVTWPPDATLEEVVAMALDAAS